MRTFPATVPSVPFALASKHDNDQKYISTRNLSAHPLCEWQIPAAYMREQSLLTTRVGRMT
jgi:hypothetical protein